MRRLIVHWIITGIALWVAVYIVNTQIPGLGGIQTSGDPITLVVVAAIFGLVNAVIGPILSTLTGCLRILTLGLFTLVVNAILLMLTSWLAGQLGYQFQVADFLTAIVAAFIISVVSFVLNLIFGA